jgi:hypothetical protein
MKQKFKLGQQVITPGVFQLAMETGIDLKEYINRHVSGDWGDLSEEDKKANDYALDKELGIFSSYEINDLSTIWIITEADRSVTTILLPEEY